MKRQRLIAGELTVQSVLETGPEGETLVVASRGAPARERHVLKWLPSTLRPDLAALAALSHPVLAFPSGFRRDPTSGRAFLLRPYITGLELAHALRGAALADILPWLVAAGDPLRVLHEAGWSHGNIKATNLLVPRSAVFARRTRAPRVILCDPASAPPRNDAATGSPMAADVLALGRIFHYLLARQEPRAGLDGLPVPVTEHCPGVPLDLDRLLAWALHPDPGRRCPDAVALLGSLRELAGAAAPRPLPALEIPPAPPQALERALEALCRPGDTRAVALAGEARTGKSGLLRRIELEAALLGSRTARVRCYRETGPASRALGALATAIVPASREGRRLRARAAALFAARAKTPPAAEPDSGARQHLLRSLGDILGAAAALEPILLCVDDAHEADPLLIELLAALVDDAGGGTAPSLRLVVAYRSEPPYRGALRPLTTALGASRSGHVLVELPRPTGVADDMADDLTAAHRAYLAGLDGDRRQTLEALAIVGRPCPVDLIGRITGRPSRRVRQTLAALEEEGTTREEGGLHELRHGSSTAAIAAALDDDARGFLHRRAALALARGPRVAAEEIARHWLASDVPGRGLAPAMQAARELARQHEDRRALRFFLAALEMLPRRSARRQAFAAEAADAHARAGEHRRAVEILAALLPDARRTSDAGHLHARLGISLHRSGDAGRATEHLERALSLLAPVRDVTGLREKLRIECELAEIAINRGEHDRADATCRRGLEQLAAARRARGDLELLRSEMVLLETQAHLHLRRFELETARELFERSLEVGERAGAAAEQSLTLNNLGILHIQENRFRDARACYERAETISSRLGDDSGLAAIHCNLAVIHAKLGDADAAGVAVERAAHHEGRCDSARTRFLRLHSTAMVDALFGRHAAAIAGFRDAIALGDELQDRRTIAFDLVYLAECHLHRGEAQAAAAALDRAIEMSPAPPVVPRMVAARRAVLAALAGDGRGLRAAAKVLAELGPEKLSYLDAWNRLFLGWAQRLGGDPEAAAAGLAQALAFFEEVGVPGGAIFAALELAALDGDRGRGAAALGRIVALRSRYTCGAGPLRSPMLSARVLAYHARALLDRDPPALEAAAALLGEAESYLIGRRLESLETVVLGLRRRLRAASPDASITSAPRGPRGSPDDLGLLEAIEEAALDLVHRGELEIGAEKASELRRHWCRLEERIQDARRAVEERPRPAATTWGTGSIVGRSSAIRELVALIRRLAPLENAVLIRGETGSGKELVARALHAESPRRESPFISVSCTALPGELLEAELFGFVRGSFSGAEEDRAGLLRAAAGGTFLFDDIGEMPLELQAKIIRALDTGVVRPLGSEEEVRLNARFLFTSSQDLRALVRERRFRSDLLFRLGGLEVTVPPLRERPEDITALLDHFAASMAGAGPRLHVEPEALQALEVHSWPGNVRELENLVTRLSLAANGPVRVADVRRLLGDAAPRRLFPEAFLESGSLTELQAALEREYIVRLHRSSGGDVEAVARALGIKVRALFDRLRRLGLRLRDLRVSEGET